MLIPVHQLDGVLLSALADNVLLMPLDTDSIGILDAKLGASDWTYLYIQQGVNYEIVKVTDVDGDLVTIERGVDGTSAIDFLAGADVGFILTTSAIEDIIVARQLAGITITGVGAIEVEETAPGVYNLTVPEFALTGEGKLVVTGSYEEGYVVSNETPLGCCD